MIGRGSTRIHRIFSFLGILASLALTVSACGTSTGPAANKGPIKIGISLSLSGDFSTDGEGFQQGYQLWADYTNSHGGLLGRQVQLDIVSDASDPQQVSVNYQKLITVDKVDLIFGPFSSLLTKPASVTANRYGFAMVEGAGGAPSVFDRGLNNIFDVSLPVAANLDTVAGLIAAMPADQRPKTVAYATEDDPFTEPQVDRVKGLLEAAGLTTAYYKVYPAETTDYTPIALGVINSKADVVIAGTHFEDITAFMKQFQQQHYVPKMLIGTAGPDQGSQFTNAVGVGNAEGVLVPNGWYPKLDAYQNSDFVNAYVAKYGGTPDLVSIDAAEAYSVGQVVAQAVTQNQSLDQTKLIATLHSATFKSLQGPVKFDSTGQNTAAVAYLFQWQNNALQVVYPSSAATAQLEYPKPAWT
jgi:branched-chain amino acid transport system substrate-binding protein